MPKDHHRTTILVRSFDHENAQALTAIVWQMFWPVGVKNRVKRMTKGSVVCFKCHPKVMDQFMGDLPAARVTVAHLSINTGVDYASTKAYMALFVCMATKAVHLELVSDLTTKATAQPSFRTTPPNSSARRMRWTLSSRAHQDDITRFCASKHITIKFIPPRAPHFGGLWEAGVKSAKYHLLRIIGPRKLYFEEMATLLADVEAILNSRPLIPGSDDVNELP
jgi:hypothetical protein